MNEKKERKMVDVKRVLKIIATERKDWTPINADRVQINAVRFALSQITKEIEKITGDEK